jgi:hypothetical protein
MNAYTSIVNENLKYPFEFNAFGTFLTNNHPTLTDQSSIRPIKSNVFSKPFGGTAPTVGQMAASSSAAAGFLSPLVPSTLNQAVSTAERSHNLLFDASVDEYYKTPIFDDMAICSQWPSKCGDSDGRFIDGIYTDTATLALNIGQYQTRENGDLDTTLKIIVTNDGSCHCHILSYFKTDFIENTTPGDFLWPTVEDNGNAIFDLPLQSPQMSAESLNTIIQPITGLTVTTAVISGAATIDNPAFKTKAGQNVDIFLINLNSDIPIPIFGKEQIQQEKQRLADMVKEISANQELLDIVKAFVAA